MCKRKLEWYKEVSDELRKLWEENLKKSEKIAEIKGPRFDDKDEKTKLCLESYMHLVRRIRKGFGMRVYIRSVFESGNV